MHQKEYKSYSSFLYS